VQAANFLSVLGFLSADLNAAGFSLLNAPLP